MEPAPDRIAVPVESPVSLRYELEPLSPEEIHDWDQLIQPFQWREVFHRQAWLNYIAAYHKAEIRYWAIREHGRTIGYFCGGVLQRGPFRILGSPLQGWYTNFMGPVATQGFSETAFFRALDELAQLERLAIIEIEGHAISDEIALQFGYEPAVQLSYVVDLSREDPAIMHRRLHPKCRKAIRLAEQFGVRAEDTDDPAFAAELFDGYKEILRRKNVHPAFSVECPQLVFKFLKPADLLFAIQMRDPDGSITSTGLFPHDDHSVYFAFTGSRVAGWKHFPNDLMQWSAMEIAAQRGIRIYNMCGYGRFKSKFGGTLHEFKRWHKCYWRSAAWARKAYEFQYRQRLRLRGFFH